MVGVGIDMWKKVREGIRYPIYILIFVGLLLCSGIAHAEDNSKWCGTITAIYGVCSEELVNNYLAHTQGDAKPSRPIVVPKTINVSQPLMVSKAQKPPDEARLLCLDKLYKDKKIRVAHFGEKIYVQIYDKQTDIWRAVKKGVCP